MLNKKLTTLCLTSLLSVGGVVQAADDPITLNWARWDVSSGVELNAIADAYMKAHPNVKVNSVDLGSADYNSMLMTQLSGGAKNIDIVTVKDVPGYTDLIRSNNVVDMTSAPTDELKNNATYQGLIDEFTVDGKLYALPIRLDFWVLYYNKALFDKTNTPYPSNDMTLEEFDALAEKVTSGFGANKNYGAYYHTWRSTVQLPSLFDGKQTLISKDYSFLKPYYERVLKLQQEGTVPRYASLKATSTHYSGPWFNATVAMLPMGSWFISNQISKVKSGESKASEWGIVKMPHPKGVEAGTTAATVTSLAVNVNSDKQEAALDFIKFAASHNGALAVAKAGGFPANQDAEILKISASRDGFPKDAKSLAALEIGKTYLEMPVDSLTPRIEVILNRTHDAIMTESESIDDALKMLNKDVAQVLN
ncbi:MAG: extracellular solute-binding protein [Vibrio sp.]|uniref:extracellular solute-binding protein n=1 Tax=Vibrio sp. TaxID=678 RepID=UPI003A87F8AE